MFDKDLTTYLEMNVGIIRLVCTQRMGGEGGRGRVRNVSFSEVLAE